MTGGRCILFLFLAIASTASAQRQHLQQGSSLGSMPTFQIQSHAVTPATGPTPMQFIPVASPAVPTPKAAGGNTSPESLYKQQRVEYTFPVPVTLAPVQRDGNGEHYLLLDDREQIYGGAYLMASFWVTILGLNYDCPLFSSCLSCLPSLPPSLFLFPGWTKAFAAFPCLQCYVTDAGCYYEYTQQAKTQIAFLSGKQFKACLSFPPSLFPFISSSPWSTSQPLLLLSVIPSFL